MPRSEADSAFQPGSQFTATHWSMVLHARDPDSPRAAESRAWLCQTYWYPLYAYVRRRGHNPDDAQDLTQDFFAHWLAGNGVRNPDPNRGRFRTYLLTSLKNFLNNGWKKANREKRGGGKRLLSLDEMAAETRFSAEPAVEQTPDTFYDQGWAGIILNRALAALEEEQRQAGKLDHFEDLKPFVWGAKSGLSYADMASQLGMTEGTVKVTVHRLRRLYGQCVRAAIAQTTETPEEADEELTYLLSVIRQEQINPRNLGTEML